MPYCYGRNIPTPLLLLFLLVLLLPHFVCFLNNSYVLGKFIFQLSVVYVVVLKSVVLGLRLSGGWAQQSGILTSLPDQRSWTTSWRPLFQMTDACSSLRITALSSIGVKRVCWPLITIYLRETGSQGASSLRCPSTNCQPCESAASRGVMTGFVGSQTRRAWHPSWGKAGSRIRLAVCTHRGTELF